MNLPTENSYIANETHALLIDRLIAAPTMPGMGLRSTIFEILADAGVLPERYLPDLLDEQSRPQNSRTDS